MKKHNRINGRTLKRKIHQILTQNDVVQGLEAIRRHPARRVVNPLFSFLLSTDTTVKWHAVVAMGDIVAGLAKDDMESARVVMRRLMWNLNDESGGIGWGSPEAMGEIMARHQGLAEEYACILVSYIRPDGNFIEHELLQKGVLWGLGRLARARSDLVNDAAGFLAPYMASEDPILRGLAAWTAGPVGCLPLKSPLKRLLGDMELIEIFIENRLVTFSVDRLARDALAQCEANNNPYRTHGNRR